jgi:hypothetical protein
MGTALWRTGRSASLFSKIPRLAVPLDWDHIWSEYHGGDNNIGPDEYWHLQDDSARILLAVWRKTLAFGHAFWRSIPQPELCQDVTDAYHSCQQDGGRAEEKHAPIMSRYRGLVEAPWEDATCTLTQGKTLHGYVLQQSTNRPRNYWHSSKCRARLCQGREILVAAVEKGSEIRDLCRIGPSSHLTTYWGSSGLPVPKTCALQTALGAL